MKSIFIIDPYYADSHRYWAESLKNNLTEDIKIFSLPPVHWKWRMEGAAIALAKKVSQEKTVPDFLLVTDFLNLALFKSLLTADFQHCQLVLYMHENQLTYPISKRDTDQIQARDNHYGFINYTSCLLAERIIFNSAYHKRSFLRAISNLSKKLPDNLETNQIESKSIVIPLTLDLGSFKKPKNSLANDAVKTIVWNHRWEYDKRPDIFFNAVLELKLEGLPFELILLGKVDEKTKAKYSDILSKLSDRIRQIGYASSKEAYYKFLQEGDIIVSTSEHDFFGVSVLEGMYAGCHPVLPNDLAYPELVPNDLQEMILYKRGNFVESLRNALQGDWSEAARDMIRTYIAKNFTWTKVGPVYQHYFDQASSETNLK